MLNIKHFAAALLLAGVSSSALADSTTGIYLDLGLGGTVFDTADLDVDNGFGGKLGVGYRFNKYFALETGFGGGEGSAAMRGVEFDVDSTSFYGAAVGILPVGRTFEFFGKLGYGMTRTDVSVQRGNTLYTTESDFEGGLVYGLGAALRFRNDKFALTLEYTVLNASDEFKWREAEDLNESGPMKTSLVSLGTRIRF